MINLKLLENCELNLWLHEDNDLLLQLNFFDSSCIYNQEKMQNLIKGFEILKIKLNAWMFENKSVLDERDICYLIDMMSNHLNILKENEGINFESCRRSVNICLRLVQFLLSSLFDYPDLIFGVMGVPKEISELI